MSEILKRWTQTLNPEQAEAVAHTHGPLLILAGAGSGKTTVLVSRAGRLIEDGSVSSERMCVLTFTNKAARELKERVGHKLGKKAGKLWGGTFHSFGLQLLRAHYKAARLPKQFGILDSSDASALVKELLSDFRNISKTAYDADKLLNLLSHWRENGIKTAQSDDEYELAAEWLLPHYVQRLEMLGMVDFDGLILKPLELMKEKPEISQKIQGLFDQVMVDEFQDTNLMQMGLIAKLVEKHRNLTVVGDDDQSIYGWRGARISNILDFPKVYRDATVIRLERNYRSSPAILNLANAVISKNVDRHGKVLKPERGVAVNDLPEVFVYENEDDEAERVIGEIEEWVRQGRPKRDIAVLYRSNSQGALVEAELRKRNLPYAISGGTAFFDRKETKDFLAYLRCALRPNEIAFRRILNTPPRGIGEKSLCQLVDYSTQKSISLYSAAQKWRDAECEERVGAALEVLFHELNSLVATLLDPATPAGSRMLVFLDQIGYRKYLEKFSANPQAATLRWRFVEIFAGILTRSLEKNGKTRESLSSFLDAMELRDYEEGDEAAKDQVQLMTLHACKGLEFGGVILMGVEEDILPHRRLGGDLSEERRLFYVGITRAQEKLILSRARRRKKHGKMVDAAPSRFLLEIPKELYKEFQGSRPIAEDRRKSLVAELFKKLDSLQPTPS